MIPRMTITVSSITIPRRGLAAILPSLTPMVPRAGISRRDNIKLSGIAERSIAPKDLRVQRVHLSPFMAVDYQHLLPPLGGRYGESMESDTV